MFYGVRVRNCAETIQESQDVQMYELFTDILPNLHARVVECEVSGVPYSTGNHTAGGFSSLIEISRRIRKCQPAYDKAFAKARADEREYVRYHLDRRLAFGMTMAEYEKRLDQEAQDYYERKYNV